jgi:hypothetical protein
MKHSKWFSKWFILPAVAVTMIATLVVGGSAAFFTDTETSNDSTFTSWTSTQWTQTSQADFNAGVLSGTNTSLSPDNVILSAGAGSGANMILFWDGGGAAPSGWAYLSNAGGAFNNRFPRGAAIPGGTGGATTHTHTVSLVSLGAPATTAVSGSGTNRSAVGHTHALASGSTVAASNLPSYRDVRVITSTGVPTTIPAGAIAIFDTTPPSGWTCLSNAGGAFDNLFPRGAATYGGTGGANTHTHSTSISLATASGNQAVSTTNPRVAVATNNHTHGTSSGTTDAPDSRPPFITVILAKADSATAIPVGMIAMFDASPTGDWSVLSAFNSRFIVGSSSYGTIGGAGTHSHANLPITSAVPSATGNASTTSPTASVASGTHTHSVTVSFGAPSTTSLPPYRDVIFAKALYAASGTIASQVLNTTVDGSRWDALFWDESLATGTDITFEVRASDESFAKDASDVSYPWTSIGGTSPVLTGLTSGRYKQWRATLTSNGSQTNTPTLQEVRVFYYGG